MPVYNCPYPDCAYTTDDVTDQLAAVMLRIHADGAHSAPQQEAARVEKVRRPVIVSGGTSEEWSYFLTRWNDYKSATKISGTEKVIQLLECCDNDLRKDLTRAAGGTLSNKPEEYVLQKIMSLAVRQENVMVARVELHEMKQDQDEAIRSFAARVKGHANVCKFVVDCPSCEQSVNFTHEILKDVIVKGIRDCDIQLDLLSDHNQDMSLEAIIKYIEAKESGKRSATKIFQNVQAASTSRSAYQKSKFHPAKSESRCNYCGTSGHGKNPPMSLRKKSCPAYGKKCTYCGIPNHSASVCRAKHNSDKSAPIDDSGESTSECPIWQELCSVKDQSSINNVEIATLSHHVYASGKWIPRCSKPQPTIRLTASINAEDYKELGLKLITTPIHTHVTAVPDTGCQSCLAGSSFIERLGIPKSHLLQVNMRMSAANRSRIEILGAVIIRFATKLKSGLINETRQIVYITEDTDKIYLSQEACIELGVISRNFPTIDMTEPASIDTDVAACDAKSNADNCDCPKRGLPPPKPEQLPFPVTCDDDVERLRKWLLNYYRSSSFNTCTHQTLPKMHGPPLRLMIDPQATPVAHHTPIPVPLHWMEQVKEGLDQDVRLGVLKPVPVGEPVTWCHRMVVCAKKDGKPRRTVDLQALNKFASRETHHTQSPYVQARSVPSGKLKTVFDCWNGYHSISLHPDDSHYTTFITPWGRYQYKVAPQGYIASGDGYCRRFDEIVAHIPDKTKCIDDTLLWADSVEQCFAQAVTWLDICGRNGFILNPDKFVFAQSSVDFAGFTITNDSVKPSSKYITAIADFPTPSNLTDIRSWFGLINQVSYAFAAADIMKPFRKLLKSDEKFYWNDDLQDIFEKSKSAIIKQIEHGVKIFDKARPTCLATDWSKTGLGYWLLQKHCSCDNLKPFCCRGGWKITLVGSRFTHTAESRYAPIEGEALAVVYALEHARHFVLGCKNLLVAVDHKPLLNVLENRSLDIPNNRLRNLKEKTLRYRFQMVHVAGVKHKATDALSRRPVGPLNPSQLELPDDTSPVTTHHSPKEPSSSALVDFFSSLHLKQDCQESSNVWALRSLHVITWDKVRLATSSDQSMEDLLHLVESGFPSCKGELPTELQMWFPFKDHLTTDDGVILYKGRIVVPPSLRPDVLSLLHCAHQGVSRMIARAEVSVFWPKITSDIKKTRMACTACTLMGPSQPRAPPADIRYPSYPFEMVCADFFTYKGKNYLVIVDRYSNWPIVVRA
ncbi:MAG: reverse transcriptase domain-containing protein, partial [Bacteroidota bacterium]